MRRGLFIICLLAFAIGAWASEYDFLFKTTTVDSGDLGRIVITKAKDSSWSAKETGTTTHRGEVFKMVFLDVSTTDYANLTTTPNTYWYVDNTATATAITTTAVSE